ncbi:hypothetical protein V8C43DRAFT_277578 [Trichoderma afarasin]
MVVRQKQAVSRLPTLGKVVRLPQHQGSSSARATDEQNDAHTKKHIMRLPQPSNCHYQPLVLLASPSLLHNGGGGGCSSALAQRSLLVLFPCPAHAVDFDSLVALLQAPRPACVSEIAGSQRPGYRCKRSWVSCQMTDSGRQNPTSS